MLGSSNARVRQVLLLTCLCAAFLLSLIIMGIIGVNGKVTFLSMNKGCILYMTVEGDVTTYNNGFCLFPIIGSAVTAVFALLMIIYTAMVLVRKDEFSPRGISLAFMILSFLCAMLAFSMCGEIGLGLNKGCKILKERQDRCRSEKNFSAIYGAQISAGIMGGFWLIASLLEFFQAKCQPRSLSATTVDHVSQTKVIPHRAGGKDEYHPEMTAPSTPNTYHQAPQKQELYSQEHHYPSQGYVQPGQQHVYPPGTPAQVHQTTTTHVVDTIDPNSETGVHYQQ
ncbi:hypothetical protein BGZ94_010057 [Podila epigama]|nr:hypothetical protein BGZ94_010057 [Podila epigama]